MTFDQVLALLGVIGGLLGAIATIMGGIALWILGGIRSDIHAIRAEFIDRFKTVEGRVDNLWADRTDHGFRK